MIADQYFAGVVDTWIADGKISASFPTTIPAESAGCCGLFRGDVERGRPESGAGRRDQTYQVPAVLIPSEAEIASDQLARKQ